MGSTPHMANAIDDNHSEQAESELRSLVGEALASGESSATVPHIMKRVEDRLRRDATYKLTATADAEIEMLSASYKQAFAILWILDKN